MPPGARLYDDGKIRIDESKVESDSLIPADQRTAKLLTEIGNKISNFIKLTYDCPSKHENGFMPILDLQVQVQENNQISYKFYSKPMSNPFVILANSALPEQMKRNSFVQEAIRHLRNTKREIPWKQKAEILSEFVNKMKISGYSECFHLETIQAAVRGYDGNVKHQTMEPNHFTGLEILKLSKDGKRRL